MLADKLKLTTAAKAWMGGIALALQIAMSYIPDHANVWYNVAQGLVGVLGLLGIYAVPNKPASDPVPDPAPAPVAPVADVPPVTPPAA
jgi:hypothetical protein